MNRPVVSSQINLSIEQRNEDSPRLHGYWLVLALLIFILYLVAFPITLQYLRSACMGELAAMDNS